MHSVIRDSRSMLAPLQERHPTGEPTGYPQTLDTPEQIEAHWQAWADEMQHRGLSPFVMAPGRTAPTRGRGTVEAYVDESRWVAQCPGGPSGKCNGGIAVWPEHEHACCLDCGTIYAVKFPGAHLIAAADKILAARPPEARHWHPHRGETIEDLKADNLKHGHGLTPEQEAMRGLGEGASTKAQQLTAELLKLSPEERAAILGVVR